MPQQLELENWRLRREIERLRERLQTVQTELDLWRSWHKRLCHKVAHLDGVMLLAPVVRQ